MHCLSTLLLGALAVGQTVAHRGRHANFHARREKRDLANVNWATVAYDLSGVDWNSVFHKTPAATPSPTPVVQAQAVSVKTTPVPSAAPVAVQQVSSKPSSSSSKSSSGGLLDTITDAIGDFTADMERMVKALGVSSAGVNSASSSAGIWIGTNSDWKVEFVNGGSKPATVFCWKANGYTGMTINVNQPAISVYLPVGSKKTIAFASDLPAACSPAYDDSSLANFGGLKNTWFEVTFGQYGTFDVSRNPNMNGTPMSAKGSKCTSDMNTCSFYCTKSNDSCEYDYDIAGKDAPGCHGGFDKAMNGIGGGCQTGSSGEKVTVTLQH